MDIPEINQNIPQPPTHSRIIKRYLLSLCIGGIGILILLIIFWQTFSKTLILTPHQTQNKHVNTVLQLKLVRLIAISANQTTPSQADLDIDTRGDAVRGISVTMQYDPKSIADVSIVPTTLLRPANITKVVNTNGTMTLNEILTSKQAINGNGTIATILFSLQKDAQAAGQTTIKIVTATVTGDQNTSLQVVNLQNLNIPLGQPNNVTTPTSASTSLTNIQTCPVGKNTATCSASQCADSGEIGDASLYCAAANQPYCCEKKSVQSNIPANYHDTSDNNCQTAGGICERSGNSCSSTETQITTCSYQRPCCRPNDAPTPTPIPYLDAWSEFYCSQDSLGIGTPSCKTSCIEGKETQVSTCSEKRPCCAVDPSPNVSCKNPSDFCYVNNKGIPALSITEKSAPSYADYCRVNGQVYQCFPNQ